MSASTAPFLLLHVPSWRERLEAIACALLLLAIFRLEALAHFSTALLGGFDGDAGLLSWLLQVGWRGVSQSQFFETPAFYPYGQTLAWSDNFILPSLIYHILQQMGLHSIQATNLLLLGASVLNGYAAWALSFALSGSRCGALSAGVGFMLAPYFTAQLGHPQLQFAFFLPWGMLALFRFIAAPTLPRSVVFGLTISLAFLTTVYYAIFIGLGGAFLLLGLLALRPAFFRLHTILLLMAGSTIGILPLLPLLTPYFAIKATFGARGLYEAYYFAANGLAYLSANPRHLFFGATSFLAESEAQLFPGLCALTAIGFCLFRVSESRSLRRSLALAGICIALTLIFSVGVFQSHAARYATALTLWLSLLTGALFLRNLANAERRLGFSILTNRALLALLLSGVVLSSFFALGPLGNPEKGHIPLGLHALLYLIVPGLDALRAITRIQALWLTFVAPLVSLTIGHLLPIRGRVPVAGTALLLLLLDSAFRAYPLQPPPPLPGAFQYLRAQPGERERAGILLPYAPSVKEDGTINSWTEFARVQVRAMHWFLASGRPTVNGYSGQQSKFMRELPRALRNFPDERSLDALSRIVGLRYLIYASSENPTFDPDRFGREITQYTDRLRWVMTDDTGHFLFELIPAANCQGSCDFTLPASQSAISLELLSTGAAQEAIGSLGEAGAEEPLWTKPLSELTEIVSMPLPPATNRARPRRLQFTTVPPVKTRVRLTAPNELAPTAPDEAPRPN